jgi:flagella basal body P-ring formation protein FlgA
MKHLLAVMVLLPLSTEAATLRAATTLSSPVVHVADLFDDAGPAGLRELGSGPAPGARIVIEAAQLAAIARQYGVDWRPGDGGDRAVLDRPGRMLPREEVLAALRAAFAVTGANADGEIELPGYAPPLIPADAHPLVTVEQLDLDGGTGRFTATLSVSGDGMAAVRHRASGVLVEMTEVPVAARRLAAGVALQPSDLRTARVRTSLVAEGAVRDPTQVAGLSPRRPIAPGQPVLLADLARRMIVTRGSRVAMQLLAPGLQLLAQGQALDAGAMGDRIQVLNITSRAIVEAEVVGTDRVRVAPGSVPLITEGGSRLSLLQTGPSR